MTTNNAVNVGLSGSTGTGNFVGATSPTLVTPALGTPSSGTLTSCTGLPIGGLTGLGTGVGTALAANVTGSGGIALATSPSFTTPTLGAALATSINFGGTTLSVYAEGTWTPIDASGASLVFSTAVGTYTRIGNLVVASCEVVYPATADGSNAIIGGLPFTTTNNAGKVGGHVVVSTVTTLLRCATNTSATTFNLLNSASVGIINSAMTGSTNYFQIIYQL